MIKIIGHTKENTDDKNYKNQSVHLDRKINSDLIISIKNWLKN